MQPQKAKKTKAKVVLKIWTRVTLGGQPRDMSSLRFWARDSLLKPTFISGTVDFSFSCSNFTAYIFSFSHVCRSSSNRIVALIYWWLLRISRMHRYFLIFRRVHLFFNQTDAWLSEWVSDISRIFTYYVSLDALSQSQLSLCWRNNGRSEALIAKVGVDVAGNDPRTGPFKSDYLM